MKQDKLNTSIQESLFDRSEVPFPAPENPKFTFIDLFAGIGGFRLALQSLGGKCVFSSEWNKAAAETYAANFGEYPHGDITLPETKAQIPETFDILCAGFPCQAFSIAGKQKGFEDTRGTLFFDIEEIIKKHHPKVVFLENVKNLIKHDGGQTLGIIQNRLQQRGYKVVYRLFNSSQFGLPQNRERVYIVAIREDLPVGAFSFPIPSNEPISLLDLLDSQPHDAKVVVRDDISLNSNKISSLCLWNDIDPKPNKPIQIGKVGKGGQGERIYDPRGHAITLSAYGGGVGSKTGLYLIDNTVRKLSPRECARIQGFPEKFYIHPSKSQAYQQFGNSVSVSVLQSIAQSFIPLLQ